MAGLYAALLEEVRRVGKTTIGCAFAQKNYLSYIEAYFSELTIPLKKIFEDIGDLDLFCLELPNHYDTKLILRKSLIIFDYIQLYPPARQAIKHLLNDGRDGYIETRSLISIKKNMKDISIPPEEHRI